MILICGINFCFRKWIDCNVKKVKNTIFENIFWEDRVTFDLSNSPPCNYFTKIYQISITIINASRIPKIQIRNWKKPPLNKYLDWNNSNQNMLFLWIALHSIRFLPNATKISLNKKFHQNKIMQFEKLRSRNILLKRNSYKCVSWKARNLICLW